MRRRNEASRRGFTLVELLVAVAIVALLVGIALPVVSQSRLAARVVNAHADLRSIGQSLLAYRQDHRRSLPPTRFSCSSGSAFPLPAELGLGGYLATAVGEHREQTLLQDVFSPTPGQSYKYRAPGPAWVNTTTYMPAGSWLWVPADAPACHSADGGWFNDRDASAVHYATWSVGPAKPGETPVVEPNKHPLPRAAWYGEGNESGLITHFADDVGNVHTSP